MLVSVPSRHETISHTIIREGETAVEQTGKTKKILKTAVCCIAAVILIAVVYAAAYSAVVKIKNPEAVPMPFGFGATYVLSGSMEPEITTDDIVLVKKPGTLQVGDVVLYNTGKGNVLHRIVEIDGDTLITGGDANNTADEPFSKSAVQAELFGIIPNGAKFVKFITNPPFVMAVIILLMGAAFTWMLAEEKKEQKRIDSLRAEINSLKEENERIRKQLNS